MCIYIYIWGFPGGSAVKNSPANVGDTGDVGSIPGVGDPLEEGMATHSSIPAWRIPWTEEPQQATVHGVAKSHTQLRKHTKHNYIYMLIHTHI